MKIKLIKEVNETEAGSVVEVDEPTAAKMIEDGDAVEYTDEEQEAEKKLVINDLKQKAIQLKAKSNKSVKKGMSKMDEIKEKYGEHYLGKAFQMLAGKAITGNNEGTAADGGNLVTTGIADLQGLVTLGSQVYDKCLKIPVSPSANAMKIPFSANADWVKANDLSIDNPIAEGIAPGTSKGVLSAATLTLGKATQTVAVTDELLEDAAGVDAWLRAEMVGKMATVLDYEILKGGGGGFTAINGNANTTASSISATPTVAEYMAIINSVHPMLQPNAEFYMSITDWNLAVGTFLSSSNLNAQYIDVMGKKLFGYPVNVVPSLAAGDVIFGDMGKYAVIETPQKLDVSTDVRFLEGEVVFKITKRVAGNVVYATRATGDSKEISAFAEKS